MTFSSWRTLPGQAKACSCRIASSEILATRLPISPREALEEVLGEERDVLPPLAQGRRADRDDLEAVEEVLAEALLLDEALEAGRSWPR